jgi:hypothetical protein
VESLIADLARVLQDFPRRFDAAASTDARQAALAGARPIDRPLSGAAHQRPQAGVRWNGVMIETTRGAKVRAPYFGRVVYADWLQGLGMLLIIAHSGGYLTLYGHAEVLYKSVGDWVSPGDVIAALSDANGARRSFTSRSATAARPWTPSSGCGPIHEAAAPALCRMRRNSSSLTNCRSRPGFAVTFDGFLVR